MPAEQAPGGPVRRGASALPLSAWAETRPRRALAAGVLAGLIAGLGQAPFNLWPLLLVGLGFAAAQGVAEDALVCPIGAGFCRDKRPEVIAAFTAAEILAALLAPAAAPARAAAATG